MGFSRQEYWSGLPFPSPGDLPDRGSEPGAPALEADALTSQPPGNPDLTIRHTFHHLSHYIVLTPMFWGLGKSFFFNLFIEGDP